MPSYSQTIDNEFYQLYISEYEKYSVIWHVVISMILYLNEYKSYKQLTTANMPVYAEIKIGYQKFYNAFQYAIFDYI